MVFSSKKCAKQLQLLKNREGENFYASLLTESDTCIIIGNLQPRSQACAFDFFGYTKGK